MLTVKIENGYISGTVAGESEKPIRVFRGIPYAAPPVGDLRWRPPQPVESWSNTRDCTVFSAIPIQNPLLGMAIPGDSEDCLYLNVMTPALKAAEKLPVMVWMHGGMYAMGSGNDTLSNNFRLPQNGVVVVTVNARLDVVGLMAHPLLSKESPRGVSGNYMFLDMLQSLQWVQRNIAAFGGDPGNVTIFGESGGGAKVATLMASPLAKGLFHRVICESGTSTAITWWTGRQLDDMEALGQKIFAKLGLDKEADPLKAARVMALKDIYQANAEVAKEIGSPWGIVDVAVDGWFMPQTPLEIYQAGQMNSAPLMVCANQGELYAMFPMLVPGYVEMARGLAKVGQKCYACIFDQVPGKWRQEGLKAAPHGLELMYVFGDWDNQTGWWTQTFLMMPMMGIGVKSRDPGLTDVDRTISQNMMKIWAQFARNGDPNVSGLIDWLAYDDAGDQYLYIYDTLQIKTGFSQAGQPK